MRGTRTVSPARLAAGPWLLAACMLLAGCTFLGGPATASLPARTAPAATTTQAAAPQPPPSPTVTPGPAPLQVEPIASPFERRRLAPGEAIAQAGLFFLAAGTGEVEAWTLAGEKAALYDTSPDSRWVIAQTAGTTYLADRRTGAAYRWVQPASRLLAAQGEHLLFLSGGQVWLMGPGQPEPVALTIPPVGAQAALSPVEVQAVVSPDGQTAAVLSGRTLYRVRFEGGVSQPMGQVADPAGGTVQWVGLQTAPRAGAIILTARVAIGAEQAITQQIERYSWQGERLGQLRLPGAARYAFSPDGRWLAWEERLSHLTQAVVVAGIPTLTPRFRVTGASLCFHDFGSGDWLADSSALIVRTADGYRLLTLDGRLVDSPALATDTGLPPGQTGEPLPAPDRSDLFAIGRRVVLDSQGRRVAAAPLAEPGSEWGRPADLKPWGLDSTELRFTLPHLGHGGRCGEDEFLLPAQVEPAPFGPLTLVVGLSADDCVNLRAAPGLRAQVLACLPGGTRLAPAPLPGQRPAEGDVYYLTPSVAWTGDSHWLRVRAPDGKEGWVEAQAGRVAASPPATGGPDLQAIPTTPLAPLPGSTPAPRSTVHAGLPAPSPTPFPSSPSATPTATPRPTVTATAVVALLCPPAPPEGRWECRESTTGEVQTRTCAPVSLSEAEWLCYEDLNYGVALEYPASYGASIPLSWGNPPSNPEARARLHKFVGDTGNFEFSPEPVPAEIPDDVWQQALRKCIRNYPSGS